MKHKNKTEVTFPYKTPKIPESLGHDINHTVWDKMDCFTM